MAAATSRRAVRIANCSGANVDPGYHMYNQATHGPVDVITGDYLSELNQGVDAEPTAKGEHPGWISTAWDGLCLTAKIASEKRIKIVINGGSLNPQGLAKKVVEELVRPQKLDLVVAYIEGDNVMHRVQEWIRDDRLPHIDQANPNVNLASNMTSFMSDPQAMPVVSANAYLGMRAIRQGLQEGADIIICGRVADASPVLGAAAWWHGWGDSDFDALAGALIAGHIIECSSYVTGSNFAGFTSYRIDELINCALPIVEIEHTGESVVTKHQHPAWNGFVTEDTVKCQLLYELQGTTYLNSDVKADITHVAVLQERKDRVRVSGVKGYPPPPTTKLAIFYKAGYQAEMLMNANGLASEKKVDMLKAQLRDTLERSGTLAKLDVLDFQWVGRPESNPSSQLASTSYIRVFAQARDATTIERLVPAWAERGMQHFPGWHCTWDFRTAKPISFLGYYPALIPQADLEESVKIIHADRTDTIAVGPPCTTEPVSPRVDFDPTDTARQLVTFGANVHLPLGEIALIRSGDKGANINLGVFVRTEKQWQWLRLFMNKGRLQMMMGLDWEDRFLIERCEMPNIRAVHFVIYGMLDRGVTSSKRLDSLAKGFGEFIGAVHVPFPSRLLATNES